MAFLFVDLTQNNNRYVQTSFKIIELLLLSAGLFSTLLMLKAYSCSLVFSSLIEFSASATRFFLCPLSICITIHLMVALILASSAFFSRQNSSQHDEETSINVADHVTQLVDLLTPPTEHTTTPTKEGEGEGKDDTMDATWRAITGEGSKQKAKNKHLNKSETRDVQVHVPPRASRLDSEILLPTTPKRKELRKAETFNDAVSARRRGAPQHDEETSINVADHVTQLADLLISPPPPTTTEPSTIKEDEDEEKDDTMDATWRAINGEGNNQKAKNKHLNKRETWDVHVHVPPRASRLDSEILLPTTPKWKELRKAETFNDAVSATRRGGLVRRDPSMSIEEFNLRVEAFIKNFNDDIRLQRQESDQRFFETINRGL